MYHLVSHFYFLHGCLSNFLIALTVRAPTQDHRIGYLLRFAEYGHVDRGPDYQRLVCWNRVCPSSRIHFGIVTAVKAWSSGRFTAMGDNLGYFDHVLVSG